MENFKDLYTGWCAVTSSLNEFSFIFPYCTLLVMFGNYSVSWLSVFVQCRCVSCHCGHQGTVVQSRIFHLCRRYAQIHKFDSFIGHSVQTKLGLWLTAALSVKNYIFRFGSGILTVPLQTANSATVVAGKYNISSCQNILLWGEWCYYFSISIIW